MEANSPKELLLEYLKMLNSRMKSDLSMMDEPVRSGHNLFKDEDELQDAFACDCISKRTYDKVSDKFYEKRRMKSKLEKAQSLLVELMQFVEEKL